MKFNTEPIKIWIQNYTLDHIRGLAVSLLDRINEILKDIVTCIEKQFGQKLTTV